MNNIDIDSDDDSVIITQAIHIIDPDLPSVSRSQKPQQKFHRVIEIEEDNSDVLQFAIFDLRKKYNCNNTITVTTVISVIIAKEPINQ